MSGLIGRNIHAVNEICNVSEIVVKEYKDHAWQIGVKEGKNMIKNLNHMMMRIENLQKYQVQAIRINKYVNELQSIVESLE